MPGANRVVLFLFFFIALSTPAHAATRVVLSSQPIHSWQSIIPEHEQLKEVSRSQDANARSHVRMQEMYSGYPVWGAEVMVHENKLANGVIYRDLKSDLKSAPPRDQSQEAIEAMQKQYRDSDTSQTLSDQKSQLLVYVDQSNKAHWAYRISFHAISNSAAATPSMPTFIVDALSFHVYKKWNDVKTVAGRNSEPVYGGGFGGNLRLGKLHYDGWSLPFHRGKLEIFRDIQQKCYFKNQHITLLDVRDKHIVNYDCSAPDTDHNSVYWNDHFGSVNGGFSPSNDVMFAAQMTTQMYKQWYGLSAIPGLDNQLGLVLLVHLSSANAYWDGAEQRAYFGDGSETFYPLTMLDVVGHEISHGFTQHHSALEYVGESGGVNEAFSDMAGMALIDFVTHEPTWQIGAGVMKKSTRPLRWMDVPSRDKHSIEHVDDYVDEMDVHYSSGIFNKAFYLLATSKNWTVRQAFGVMLHANQYYWTSTATFREAACGVVASARDLLYSAADVAAAFKQVGIETRYC